MSQRRGRSAENRFRLLCSDAGVTCNKSEEDDHGWDFIIEFQSKSLTELPADREPAPLRVLVQVKSTRQKEPKCRLKLSNARNFANTESPCFIVLFQETVTGEIITYAKHYWEDLITQSLYRVREADHKGRSDLHKLNMTVGFSLDDSISDNLISWIKDTVGSYGANYSELKQNLSRNVGYGERSYAGTFTFSTEDSNLDRIIDHQLGLIEGLAVENFRLEDQRFGIPSRNPIAEGQDGVLKIGPSEPITGQLQILDARNDAIWLKAYLTFPSWYDIPLEQFKFKIETKYFEWILKFNETGKIELPALLEKKHSLEDIRELLTIVLQMVNGGVRVAMWFDDKQQFEGELRIKNAEEDFIWQNRISVTETLQRVSSNLAPGTVQLSISEIVDAGWNLVNFEKLINLDEMKFKVSFDKSHPELKRIENLLTYVQTQVGEWLFIVVFYRPVVAIRNDNLSWIFDLGESVWDNRFVFRCDDEEQISLFHNNFDNRVKLEGPGTICISDYLSFAENQLVQED